MSRAPVPKSILRHICALYAGLATFAATGILLREVFPGLNEISAGFLALVITVGVFYVNRDTATDAL